MIHRTILARVALGVVVVLVGGWMLFDGVHALTTGDYVTPSTGTHAGELGPWAALVSAVGLEPRSTGVTLLFVAYGLAYLLALFVYLVRPGSRSSTALQILACLGLWYLPFGFLLNLVAIGLLRFGPLRNLDTVRAT